MRKDDLQYLADSIFINRISSQGISKRAGLFESFGFGDIGSKIIQEAKSLTSNSDSRESALSTVKEFIITGALFKIHPLLGIANAVAKTFLDIDLIDIAKKVFSSLTSGSLSLAALNNVGKLISKSGSSDLLKEFRVNAKDNPITDIASYFANLAKGRPGKFRTLIFGIVIWAIKSTLIGAGLLVGGKLIKNFISGKSKDAPAEKPEEKVIEEVKPDIKDAPSKLISSGQGTQTFKNDKDNLWMVPIVSGNLISTLLSWTKDIYPELEGYTDEIRHNSNFNIILAKLSENYHEGTPELIMPIGFHSRKEVVDKFAPQVANLIGKG